MGQIQLGRIARRDLPRLDQRNGDLLGADGKCDIRQRVGKAELERDVFLGVAVVVDMDLVEPVRVQREIIRTAVCILQRHVVGDHGHESLAAGFIAPEHIEIGSVDLGLLRDEWRFAMAGGARASGQNDKAHAHDYSGKRLGHSAPAFDSAKRGRLFEI